MVGIRVGATTALEEDGLKVELGSRNSILFTDVEADLGLPDSSTSLPNTCTPQSFTRGFSQGRGPGDRGITSPSLKVSSGSPEVSLWEDSMVPPISSSSSLN